MKPERWKKIDELVQAALDRSEEERSAFIAEACEGDDLLRREVESLLAYHNQASKFLESPAIEQAAELFAPSKSHSLEGETISHYKLTRKIGEGGMGAVYLARDTSLDRQVAIKFISADSAEDELARRRMVREARAAARLDHANICSVYEVAEQDGSTYILMQYVEGETLAEKIKRKPLEIKEANDIAVQAADALAEAHSRGIIHRDIKPQNIMITARGQVKVLDFGLAKMARQRPTTDSQAETEGLLTRSGMIVGTVPYISPEQVRGQQIDERSDIFSFGVVLYEMLTGQQPFAAESGAATMSAILTKEPAAVLRYVPDASEEVQRIVRKCLAKERERRYQTMRDVAIDLENERRRYEAARLDRSHSGLQEAKTVSAPTDLAIRLPKIITPRRALAATAVTVVLAVAMLVYSFMFGRTPADSRPEIKSIAVLPLANLSGDPAQEYFADGMTEALIAELAKIGALRVTSRTSVMQYKGAPKSLPQIGRELNVDAVIEGSVQRSGEQALITVQLIHAATERHLWVESFQRNLRDILALQSEVGRAIAHEIKVKLTPQEQSLLASARPVNPEALDAYLRGRDYFNQGRNTPGEGTKELFKTSTGYFEQAIRIQPDYALAYAGLARACHWQGDYSRAEETAMKALQIDETVAEAHGALAYVLAFADRDWTGAEMEFKRAIDLNPSYSEAHWGYALFLMALGRHEEAIREIHLAQQSDPGTTSLRIDIGAIYLYARQYDLAVEQFRMLPDPRLNFRGHDSGLGLAYIYMKRYDEGIAELRKGIELSGNDPSKSARLAWAYALSGNKREATRILDESLKWLSSGGAVPKEHIALTYAALGDRDKAFYWLEKACEEDTESSFLKVDPAYDGLRSDPRFTDLLRRIGFPQ